MKKLLNNVGMTLVEVVAATVILGVIAAPLLNVMLEIMKTNIRSDVELRMNVQIQKAIEEIKAKDSIPEPIYFDKRFKEVDESSKLKRYEIIVSDKDKITSNSINTDENYDRWDFEVRIDNSLVKIYSNKGILYNDSGDVYNKKYIDGKLFVREDNHNLVWSGNTSNLALDFIGKLKIPDGDKDYLCMYTIGGIGKSAYFIPGFGSVQVPQNQMKDNPLNNYICVNIIKGDIDSAFNLNVTNSTYYDKYENSSSKRATLGGLLQYKKSIMINVFNDDDNKILINNSKAKPYVYINKVSIKDSKIVNGHKISIIIKDTKSDAIVKEVSTVIGEDIK